MRQMVGNQLCFFGILVVNMSIKSKSKCRRQIDVEFKGSNNFDTKEITKNKCKYIARKRIKVLSLFV